MQKKVMALAVAGVLAAPVAAFAQANYEIYGRLNMALDQYQATGGAAGAQDYKSRNRILDQGSRVGFRGAEDLGGGLKAIFQIESGVNVDTGTNNGQAGTPNASSGFWASRDSFVGLEGGFGRVTFGRQSIWWANGAINQFQANYINAEIPWANGTAMGHVRGPSARESNVLAYTTPTVSGLNATLSYAPQSEAATAGANTDGQIIGLTARYTSGTIVAQYDYGNNKGASPTTAASSRTDITGNKLGLGFIYAPGALVSVVYTQNTNKDNAAAQNELKQNGWVINWEHTFGQFQVLASYGQLGKLKVNGNEIASSDSKGMLFGGRYLLSKRTWLYATYNQIKNGDANNADYLGGNVTSVAAVTVGGLANLSGLSNGQDPRMIALGVQHNF